MAKKTGTVKKKVVKVGALGMAFVHSTFNNVIITITNEVGEVISWSAAGKMGFRGSKKNTPYALKNTTQLPLPHTVKVKNQRVHGLSILQLITPAMVSQATA